MGRLLPGLCAFLALAAPVAGQEAAAPAGRVWLVGGSVGVPGTGTDLHTPAFTVGVHATNAWPDRAGLELSVGLLPRALFDALLAVGARGGVTRPLAISERVALWPMAGGSIIGAVGSGITEALPGLYAGIAATVLENDVAGMKAGITWHRFNDVNESIWLLEFGFVRRR